MSGNIDGMVVTLKQSAHGQSQSKQIFSKYLQIRHHHNQNHTLQEQV